MFSRTPTKSLTVPSQATINLDVLARVDILRGLTAEQRILVGDLGKEVTLPQGYILATYGSHADNLYLILEGSVELSVPTTSGYLPVRVVCGGESVPLSSLLGEGNVITTAVTLDASVVITIPAVSLVELCHARPDIGVVILESVARILAGRYAATLARLMESTNPGIQNAELWAAL